MLIGFVGPLAFAVFFLPLGISSIGESRSAARGGGEHGKLQITEQDCSGRGKTCQAIGVYTSDDGARTAYGVRLVRGVTDDVPAEGETVPVTWQGVRSPQVVYPEGDSTSWLFDLGIIVAGAVAALWSLLCTWSLVQRMCSRRRSSFGSPIADRGSRHFESRD